MEGVDHTSRDHALLSASGASRWMNCPPSARLEEKAVDRSGDSVYAQEGTLAHELSDIVLQAEWKGMSTRTFNAQRKKIHTAVKKLFPDNHEAAWAEMERETKKYTDTVSEQYRATLKDHPDAVLLLEQRLDYSHIVPQGFGTGDAMVVSDDWVWIADLKYGKGIEVEAKSNPQMMLYALGALQELELVYDIRRVSMNVVQPRLNNFSKWECSVEYLNKWGETIVRPKAKLAFEGKGEKSAGDHCKWCKVKPVCRALADHNLELARHDFRAAEDMSLEELAGILLRADMLTDWLSSVKQYLFEKALAGEQVPHHKLVIGRSDRVWTDQPKVVSTLAAEGFKPEEYMKSTLQGIPTIEKLMGKEAFMEKLEGAWDKPQGKPTLVHVTDKREPYGLASARADFAEELD